MTELVEQIDALLALNAKGAVSHPVPGLAVELLERAKVALSRRSASNTAGDGVKDEDEAYEIGRRDGYEEAVQHIDERTGGDGEYRYCTDHDPDRHTPTPQHMIERIVERFAVLPAIQAGGEPVAWWDVQEFKVWKGIDPEKPVWHSRGFCCRTWADANDLLEYLQHNSPETLLRVTLNPHSASPSTRPATPVSAEVTVTDEMMQAAVRAYREKTLPVYPIVPANHFEALDAALNAALATLDRGRG